MTRCRFLDSNAALAPCFTFARAWKIEFGHRISYLRVSITDRCNERCTYCMPRELQEWLPREDVLTYEETLRLIRIAARLGVSQSARSPAANR